MPVDSSGGLFHMWAEKVEEHSAVPADSLCHHQSGLSRLLLLILTRGALRGVHISDMLERQGVKVQQGRHHGRFDDS